MKQTPNYNLNKLEGPDTADLTQFNPNWDSLDVNLKQLEDDQSEHKTQIVTDGVHGMGSAASKTAQKTTTDSTVDRVLLVGAFGLGAEGAFLSDADTVLDSGFYCISDATLGMPVATKGFLWHIKRGSGYIAPNPAAAQMFISGDGRMWVRRHQSQSWQNWNEVYHEGNKPTSADVGAVNKAGDTMTGMLTLNNGRTKITGFDGANNHIVRFTDDGDYIFKINRAGAMNYNLYVSNNGSEREVWHSGNLPSAVPTRIYNGQLQYYDGGWKDVGVIVTQPRVAALSQHHAVPNTWYTVVNVTGSGLLNRVSVNEISSRLVIYETNLRITIDDISYIVDLSNGGNSTGFSSASSIDLLPSARFKSSLKVEMRHTELENESIYSFVDYTLE